ncbi:MAG: AMP-binding protein, partial [Promethearchaeota archaeon]
PSARVKHPNGVSFLKSLQTLPNVPEVSIDPEEDPAVYMMTGGTTGVPKAAVLTHRNVLGNVRQSQETLCNQSIPGKEKKIGRGTGMFGVLPLYHSFAMTTVMNLAVLVGGWSMLFPKPPPTEELLKTFQKMPDYNGFIYCAAEILFQRIAELPEETIAKYDIAGKLTLCVSGAGPLHEYVRIPYETKTGAKIREGYGLAEASPVVSANNFFGPSNPGTIGVPFPGTDWAIFPIDDFDQGPIEGFGEESTGEICVSGPQVMKEYLNEPKQSSETLKEWDSRIWLRTGDIGFMDEFGRIAIRDRKKQLIKMAGHSVFPKEVESLLGNHPMVLEVAVAGLPDKKTGEAVKAWVALKPEAEGSLTSEELMEWAKENITHWKCPKYLDIIDEVPKTIVGKVMRRTLQENDDLWKEKYVS